MSTSYRELMVWQKAMDVVVSAYKLTEEFPKSEMFGLTSQIRRSSVSIPSNIAEGRYRSTTKDYCHFLILAYGSGAELETQVELSGRLAFGSDQIRTELNEKLIEVMKMLNAMIQKLRSINQ